MAKLIVRFPNNEIKEVEFDKPQYKIGRAEDNDLVLDNEEVAPYQAVIETSNNVFTLVDLSKDKSTLVNGKKFDRVNLTYGDRISFGPVVALFYPSKKSKISDRMKLFLYLSAGAVIIVASILLILLFITPRISTTVTSSIGGSYLEEKGKAGINQEGGIVKEQIQRKGIKQKKAVKKGEIFEYRENVIGRREEGFFKRFAKNFTGLFKKGEKLKLPEPTPEEIASRTSVAIPGGIRKIFFRKKTIYIEPPVSPIEEQKVEVKKESLEKINKEIPEKLKEEIEQKEALTENIPEKEEVPRKGFFAKIVAPFKKLFKKSSGKEEQTPEEAGEVPENEYVKEKEIQGIPAIETAEKEKLKKEVEGEIKDLLNPLVAINKIEVSEVLKRLPEETPVYSKEELGQIKKESVENIFKGLELSKKESINTDVLWIYPSGIEETGAGKTIYSGAIGKFDKNKYRDFIFSTKNGKIVLIDGKNGEEIYQVELNNEVYSPVVTNIDKNRYSDFVVLYKSGNVEAYNENLEKIWSTRIEHSITSEPLLIDVNNDGVNDLIVPDLGMEILALDGRTGFEIWNFNDLEGEVDSAPVGYDVNNDGIEDVIVNGIDGYVYVIDGKTGWGLWKRKIFGIPAGSPVVADLDGDGLDDIITLTKNGILTAFSNSGKRLFTLNFDSKFIIPPSAGDIDKNGKVDIVLMDTKGRVFAIEGKTRRRLWMFETEETTSFGRIALADVNMDKALDVILSVPAGLVYVIDGKTGTLISDYNIGDYIFSTPIVYDINHDKYLEILVISYSGVVYCIRPSGAKKHLLYLAKSSWISNNSIYNRGFSEIKNKLKFWN